MIPGYHGLGVVRKAVYLQFPRAPAHYPALQGQHVGADDATAGAHLLR